MRKHDKSIALRVTPEWLERLDEWIAAQTVPPSRTDVIRAAVDRFIGYEAKQERDRRRKKINAKVPGKSWNETIQELNGTPKSETQSRAEAQKETK